MSLDSDSADLVDYSVQYLDSHNQVLASHLVETVRTDEPTDALAPLQFGLTNAPPSGTVAKVRLRAGTTEIDLLEFGRNAPELTVFEPASGAYVDQSLTVRWESYDSDGDVPHFMIQYRAAAERAVAKPCLGPDR